MNKSKRAHKCDIIHLRICVTQSSTEKFRKEILIFFSFSTNENFFGLCLISKAFYLLFLKKNQNKPTLDKKGKTLKITSLFVFFNI